MRRRWSLWLKHCVASRKVAGSIPGGIIEIFNRLESFGHTRALRSTQPVREMAVEGGQCVRLTTLPPLFFDCAEILGASNS